MRFAEIRILLYEVEKQTTCNSKIYMNKTNSVVLVSGTIILALGIGCHSKTSEKTTAEQQQKPNIIFILCDDMGYGDLACYGQKYIETPNLDRLAAEGMLFTQAYAGSPVSAPSRASLMTGQHTGHCKIRGV